MALAVDVPGVAEYVRGRLARYKVPPHTDARAHTHTGAGTEQTHHAQAREAREQGRRTLAGENHPPPRPPTHMCTRPRLQADEMFKAADAAEEDEDEEDEDVEAMNAMLLGATPPPKKEGPAAEVPPHSRILEQPAAETFSRSFDAQVQEAERSALPRRAGGGRRIRLCSRAAAPGCARPLTHARAFFLPRNRKAMAPSPSKAPPPAAAAAAVAPRAAQAAASAPPPAASAPPPAPAKTPAPPANQRPAPVPHAGGTLPALRPASAFSERRPARMCAAVHDTRVAPVCSARARRRRRKQGD